MARMTRLKIAAAGAALLMTLSGGAAFAAEATESAPSVMEPVQLAGGRIGLEGELQWSDLEGGFWTVGGWGLMGDESLFSAMKGKQVIVTGKEFEGMSIRMVRQIEVSAMLQNVEAGRPAPAGVTVAGKAVSFDQGPVMKDGVLMVPLRFVVEAAGGTVEWNEKEQMVIVTMPDRMAYFVIGEEKAEMNENNVRYLVRNMLPMEHAPVLENGRTLISADAVTRILGLVEQADLDANLDLVSAKE